MPSPSHRCRVTAAALRQELKQNKLNVRYKPEAAPQNFITPLKVKSILKNGPVQQLFLCSCSFCNDFSGCLAGERESRYQEDELAGPYATVFALLITENCAGLIYEFQKRKITLDKRIYREQLKFLESMLTERFGDEIQAKDVVCRILQNQFKFYAQPFEIRNVEMEIEPEEALPIDEDEEPLGKGDTAEVFRFKIWEEYKGSGYKDRLPQKLARKVYKSKKKSLGLDEWCKLLKIHKLIEKPHRHIVETLGAFQYGDTFSIIFPLAEFSLEGYFQREKSFKAGYTWDQMEGLASGLAFLHGLRDDDADDGLKRKGKTDPIIIAYHLDLKPDNILIINGIFQIADFGLSTVKNRISTKLDDSGSGDASNRGYMAYAPPEQVRFGCKPAASHDIWSLGAIFSEMATHDIRPSGKAYSSIGEYRKNRMLDEVMLGYGLNCFHNNSELKEAVRSQHDTLSKTIRNNLNSNDPDGLWQANFYKTRFFDLINQMLDNQPTARGTAAHVKYTLKSLRTEANERRRSSTLSQQGNQWASSFRTIWEQADTGELQSDYGIQPQTLYLKAYLHVPGSEHFLCECAVFFDGLENEENLSIRIIRHIQPELERVDQKEMRFTVSRNIDEMIPIYATKPPDALTTQPSQPNDLNGITIRGPKFKETLYFTQLSEAYDFQRMLLQQYAVSRFYPISEVAFKGKLFHADKMVDKGDIYLQLWSNHDLSGSKQPTRRPKYEDADHIVRNDFKIPATASSGREANPVRLIPSHENLNTVNIDIKDTSSRKHSVSHSIPIPLKAPNGYDTKFKNVSLTFTNTSDPPYFWSDLEKLQRR